MARGGSQARGVSEFLIPSRVPHLSCRTHTSDIEATALAIPQIMAGSNTMTKKHLSGMIATHRHHLSAMKGES